MEKVFLTCIAIGNLLALSPPVPESQNNRNTQRTRRTQRTHRPTKKEKSEALNKAYTFGAVHRGKVDMFGYSIENVIEMLVFILNNTYVSIEGELYKQNIGIGTGSHTSPPYADIIIDYTFCTAIEKNAKEPEKLAIYVDDSWAIWEKDEDMTHSRNL